MGTRQYTPYAVRLFGENCFSLDKDRDGLGPFSIGDINWDIHTSQTVKDTKSIVESELLFAPARAGLPSFCGFWKIEGKLILFDQITGNNLLEVVFSCSDRQPFHKFESRKFLGKALTYELHFTNLVGMGLTPRPNFFEPNDMTDVCLLLGEGEDKVKLHLSKAVLAHFSEFFKAMFFGGFAEKNRSEVKLEDVCADDFLDLLDLCLGSYLNTYHEDEMGKLLALADRFAMPVATKRLLSIVLDHYDEDHVIPYLIWADKYNLTFLMSRVMEDFTLEDVEDLQKREERHDLQAATFLAVMNAVARNAKK